MPTKKRNERETRQKAEKLQRSANIPAYIKKRIDARKSGATEASRTLTNILSNLPKHQAYLNLNGGLLIIDSDGSVGTLSKSDPSGSANDVRADARNQNIKELKKMYPQDWLKRSGAKRIALAEAGKQPKERAVMPTKSQPGPISERTVQDYFRKIRKATKVP